MPLDVKFILKKLDRKYWLDRVDTGHILPMSRDIFDDLEAERYPFT